ncbi:putative phosphatase regulatory subunit-domain-containing protein [Coemansia spiralis]|nr:putative phosphatase regulatory subunit-domain-containing protein [Coemansia spiralis]
MYIPASSSTLTQQPLSSATSMARETDFAYKIPTFSLKMPSLGKQRMAQKKKPVAYNPPDVLRKDSGEVVRPCLRRRSATTACITTTPTPEAVNSGMRTPRFVHFGADLECVRWFLKAQCPKSVCEDAMPDYFSASEDERSKKNMSRAESERNSTVRLTMVRRPMPSFAVFEESPVVIERVELENNKRCAATLRGTIKVHNIAFEKNVVVRYSFDQWRTVEEAPATYARTLLDSQGNRPGVDRFTFTLSLPAFVTASLPATVAICTRYNVAGQEFWDNNKGSNYIVKISLPAAPAIADDDADRDTIMVRDYQPDLRAPRQLSFATSGAEMYSKHDRQVPSLPSAADTRRYMAQSAAVFSSQQQQQSAGSFLSSAGVPAHDRSPSEYVQDVCSVQPELPLYQEVAWRGSSSSSSPSMLSQMPNEYYAQDSSIDSDGSSNSLLMPSSVATIAGGGNEVRSSPIVTPPRAASASPLPTSLMRTGSPLRHVVFDSDGTVRTGSPLVWSHSAASVLQC